MNSTSGHAVAANFIVRMPRAEFLPFNDFVSQQTTRQLSHAIMSGLYHAPEAKRKRIACARIVTPGCIAFKCNSQSDSSLVGGLCDCRTRFGTDTSPPVPGTCLPDISYSLGPKMCSFMARTPGPQPARRSVFGFIISGKILPFYPSPRLTGHIRVDWRLNATVRSPVLRPSCDLLNISPSSRTALWSTFLNRGLSGLA